MAVLLPCWPDIECRLDDGFQKYAMSSVKHGAAHWRTSEAARRCRFPADDGRRRLTGPVQEVPKGQPYENGSSGSRAVVGWGDPYQASSPLRRRQGGRWRQERSPRIKPAIPNRSARLPLRRMKPAAERLALPVHGRVAVSTPPLGESWEARGACSATRCASALGGERGVMI
jgi:hypothetical protein